MKHTTQILLAVMLFFAACKKDKIPPIGDPADKLEGITDTWKLVRVDQADPAVASEAKTFDITEFFITGAAPRITFDAATKTYTYVPENSPNFLGATGTWQFDDDKYPTAILARDAATGSEAVWSLGGPTNPVDNLLKIAVQRGQCASDAQYFYLFTFERE